MKHLVVLRHAKSSWADNTVPDHDRPLNARGRWAAPRVARALSERGCAPDLAWCSTAARTRQTWELMAPCFERASPEKAATVRFLPELYLATRETLLELAGAAAPEAETLMVLGHNPGVHSLACTLARTGEPEEMALLRQKMPTGTAVVVDLDGDRWDQVSEGGSLAHLILPRRLDGRTTGARP